MPLAPGDQRAALEARLAERPLLAAEDARLLLDRLEVTLRGFDLRPSRPNAVLLLLGEVAARGEALAEAIAAALFGAEERVVSIDFSRMTESHHVNMLLGAPPGYVGYSEALPLHRVAQIPWCVLRCEHVDLCHPTVLQVLVGALAAGFFTDARGKRIYLSDTVVLLTAGGGAGPQRPLGDVLRPGSARPADPRRALEERLGPELLARVDLVCSAAPDADSGDRRWLEKHVLGELAERYREHGVEVHWEESLIEWLLSQQGDARGQGDLERLVDGVLAPPLVKHLPDSATRAVKRLRVRWVGGAVRVETAE
jgi:ATP-dependent Clp protease ATP-binding subunit ClpC